MARNSEVKSRWMIIPRRSKGIFVWDNRTTTFIGYHVHHGAVGVGLCVTAPWHRKLWLVVIGLLLMLDDRDDFPWIPEDLHIAKVVTS